MRCKSLSVLLVLPLLTGCLESDQVAAQAQGDGQPAAGPKLVRLSIDQRFSTAGRAKILRAVNEWNVTLNGIVRIDIAEAADDGGVILRADRLTGHDLEDLMRRELGHLPRPANPAVAQHRSDGLMTRQAGPATR